MNKIVLAVNKSQNAKMGLVSATYAPIQSCPKTCPFLNNGCYAQTSFCGMWLHRLNKAAKETKKEYPRDIAREEAKLIKKMKGNRPLRLHVVGDCRTNAAAETIAKACKVYSSKYNQPVWTYTHAWRDVNREAWGDVSVLASCETIKQCYEAIERGYTTSMVYPNTFTKSIKIGKLKLIPCLEMTKGIKCSDCKLCFSDNNKNRVICFFPHGSGAEKVKQTIEQ